MSAYDRAVSKLNAQLCMLKQTAKFQDPKLQYGMGPVYVQMCKDLREAFKIRLTVRREKLLDLFKADFLQEEYELRVVGLKLINTAL